MGGTAPLQYQWLLYDGARWNIIGQWGGSNSYQWTPTYADPNFQIGVWVRSAGSTATLEASASMAFPITSSTSSTPPATTTSPSSSATVTSVVVVADQASPQALGTTINFAAAAAGGSAPLEYKWLVYDGLSWQPVTSWSTSTTYAWTPSRRDPNYRVGVWVRSANRTADAPEASRSVAFPIQ